MACHRSPHLRLFQESTVDLRFPWAWSGFSFKRQEGRFNESLELLLYFCGLMVSAIVLQLTHLTFVDNSQIMLFGDYGDGGAIGLDRTFVNVFVMVAIFGLATMIFVGMGQETGKLFDRLWRPIL